MSYRNKLIRVTMLCYLPIVVMFATIRMLSAFGVLDFLKNDIGSYLLNLIVQVGLLFCVSFFLFGRLIKSSNKNVAKFFGFKKIKFNQVCLSIVIGIVVYILNVLITTFFNAFLTAFGYHFSSGSPMKSYPFWLLIVELIFTAVLPAVCEETAHRGLLLKGLSPLGLWGSIFFSALFFGLLHLNIEQAFYATLIGMLVGYIALGCESIFPAMIIHFMNNAISVFMGYSSFHGLGLNKGFVILDAWLSNSPILGMLFMVLLIAVLFIVLKFLLKRLFRQSAFDKMNTMQRAMIEQYEREKYLKEVELLSRGNGEEFSENNLREEFFEKFDEKYSERALKSGLQSDISHKLQQDEGEFKLDKINKVLIYTTFIIVGVITIFSFIWGIL